MLRGALLLIAGCVAFGCSSQKDAPAHDEPASRGVPESLVPKGKQSLFMARGEGVQIYIAEEKDGKLQWTFQSPEAVLLDYKTGDKVGTHSSGPTWVDQDGGKLTGKKLASEDAPNADAVPWLLLEAKAENGGRFSKVTHIQRLDTWGGRAPVAGPTRVGETREVRYEATYVFLGDR